MPLGSLITVGGSFPLADPTCWGGGGGKGFIDWEGSADTGTLDAFSDEEGGRKRGSPWRSLEGKKCFSGFVERDQKSITLAVGMGVWGEEGGDYGAPSVEREANILSARPGKRGERN